MRPMTTITLNLLAEELLAQKASARDPLKWAVAIGTLAVSLTVMGGVAMSMASARKRAELGRLQARWDAISSPENGHSGTLEDIKAMAGDFVEINRSRNLRAPQLAIIKGLVTDSVQLMRLSLNTITESLGPVVNASDDKDTRKRRYVAPPKTMERTIIRLDGKCVARRPEMEVDAFIQALRNDPEFAAQLERMQLRNIVRGPAPPENSPAELPSSTFVIDCLLKERK